MQSHISNSRCLGRQFALELSAPGFSLDGTLNCGQCFRWEQEGDRFTGVVNGRRQTIHQKGDVLYLECGSQKDTAFWRTYFDLDGDYACLKNTYQSDPILAQAVKFAGGITLLRQDPWEALCSFILSQNNNIPRIKGIVRRLCEQFGTEAEPGCFSFPKPEIIAPLEPEQLAGLRAGFRAKYVIDAARKVTDGTIDLNALYECPLDEARKTLQTISGVGPKVAECALLYGLHRLDAFPVDVWIKRVLAEYYPDGFPAVASPGVAQQYLFHSIRCGQLSRPNGQQP